LGRGRQSTFNPQDAMNPTQLPHVMDFRGHYGRLCTLAAQALTQGNASREAVRVALGGDGDNLALTKVREQRTRCNTQLEWAITALGLIGVTKEDALILCRDQARLARLAVEGEWGYDRDNSPDPIWDHLAIPMVQTR
jgi:hypothetical protein